MNLTAYHPYPISNPSTQYHSTLMENPSISNSTVPSTTNILNDFNNNLSTNNRRIADTESAKVTLPPISSIINTPQEQKNNDIRTEVVQSENPSSLRTSPLVHKDIATANSMNNSNITPAGPGVTTLVQPMGDSRRSSATQLQQQQQQQQMNINYATPRNGMALLSGISSQATPIGTPVGSPNNNYLANQAIIQQENEAAAYAIQQRQQLQQIQYQQQAQVQVPQQGYYYVVAPFQEQQQQVQVQAQPQQVPQMMPMSITQQQIAFQKAQAQQAQAAQQQVQQQRMAQIAQQQHAISTYPVVVSMPHPTEIQQSQQQQQQQNVKSPEFENSVVYQVPRQPEGLMNAGQSILVPTTTIPTNSQKPTMTTSYVTSEGLIPVPTSIQSNLSLAVRLRKQCPVCGKICSRPSTLKTHYLIHTGDTPFKCPWKTCKKSFNVKSNMLRHLKSHQKKSPKVTKSDSLSGDEESSTENEKKISAI